MNTTVLAVTIALIATHIVYTEYVNSDDQLAEYQTFYEAQVSITAKNTNRVQFDKLLHNIIPDLGNIGNLKSAMKKQTDSNDEKNYINYDSPVSYQRDKCSDLCQVGAELEECLTPVLEKIHHKKWDIKKNPR